MPKNKIHIDPKKIDSKIILKHKDYNQFTKGYRRFYTYYSIKNLYQNRKLMNLILVIAIVLLAIFFFD